MNDKKLRLLVSRADGDSMELVLTPGLTINDILEEMELILMFIGYAPLRLDWEYREGNK